MPRADLPSLDLLVPFEAAARHGSFTRAAAELNVTQSAVSQRVRTLEGQLGVALFERRHRAIALTAEGRDLLNGATVALQHLRAATRTIRDAAIRAPIRLGVDTSMAAFWLMPRLQARFAEDPELSVDLIVSDTETEVLAADVAILHGDGSWAGFETRLLFRDEVFPVCAPEFRHRHGLRGVADLARVPLIELDYVHWNWMNWGIWMTRAGLTSQPAGPRIRSNSYSAVVEAARAGLGVALGWGHLLERELERGALMRPVETVVRSEYGYHLLIRHDAGGAVQRFARDLLTAGGRWPDAPGGESVLRFP